MSLAQNLSHGPWLFAQGKVHDPSSMQNGHTNNDPRHGLQWKLSNEDFGKWINYELILSVIEFNHGLEQGGCVPNIVKVGRTTTFCSITCNWMTTHKKPTHPHQHIRWTNVTVRTSAKKVYRFGQKTKVLLSCCFYWLWLWRYQVFFTVQVQSNLWHCHSD